MNRRELFKGAAAALAAASIPFPFVEDAYGTSPMMQTIGLVKYLNNVKIDLIHHICYPPCVLDGHRVRPLPTKAQEEALVHVNRLLKELT